MSHGQVAGVWAHDPRLSNPIRGAQPLSVEPDLENPPQAHPGQATIARDSEGLRPRGSEPDQETPGGSHVDERAGDNNAELASLSGRDAMSALWEGGTLAGPRPERDVSLIRQNARLASLGLEPGSLATLQVSPS
jgi:hypothetical protein